MTKKVTKIVICMSICLFALWGCSLETTDSKDSVYEAGYIEGYEEAVDIITHDLIPWSFVDSDELVDAIYEIYDDDYAYKLIEAIFDYCEKYDVPEIRENMPEYSPDYYY